MDQDDRNIRIFISSTFRDMHAEREELVKFTFPELRKRCRERGVGLLDVDLRWGVTDEQKAEGQVLPICLAEIERCRPYFIGLLGERYGWVPDEINPELVDDQPWLEEHREKSVTDLEIQHGVLEEPAMDGIAFFYFRDPETSKQVEAELAKERDYQSEPESTRSKLEHLKKRIKDSDVSLREDYPDAKVLGHWILEDLWAVIDCRFPEDQKLSALESTRMDHEAFAAVRRKVYIGRPEYYQRLDEHAAGDDSLLVLLGKSGSGKSALLANWVEHYQTQHPDDFLLLHFIGCTADSADIVALQRRIMQEIQERYEPRERGMADGVIREAFSNKTSSDEIPSDPQKVIEAFPLWLAKAAAGGRFILVLDALNQLEDRDNARDLGWLPTFFPANVRVILSTLPGHCLEALQKRELRTLEVKAIEEAERKQFIDEYLDQYRKRLDQNYVDRIAAAPQSANPLYLRTLLEELRVFGKHEALGQLITHYLKADTADDLFERVLGRLEQDYEQQPEHQGLVKKVMTLIWASRRGLSESEILELIELPPAAWSPLYLALEESLVSRSGLLNYFHDFLRKAVEDRYLPDDDGKSKVHRKLALYFGGFSPNVRMADEYPWQFRDAECWDELYRVLASNDFFHQLYAKHSNEVLFSWDAIQEHTAYRAANHALAYVQSDDKFDSRIAFAWSQLLTDLGEKDAVKVIRKALLDRIVAGNNIDREINDLVFGQEINEKLDSATTAKDYEHIICLTEKWATLNRGLRKMTMFGDFSHDIALATALRMKGRALGCLGKYDFAFSCLTEAEGLLRDAEDMWGVALCIGGKGTIFLAKGDLELALGCFKEEERISRQLGRLVDVGRCMTNQGLVFERRRDFDEAVSYYQKACKILEPLGAHAVLAQTLFHSARTRLAQGDLGGAEHIVLNAIEFNKRTGDDSGLCDMTTLQSAIYYAAGRYLEARTCTDVAIGLARHKGDPERLQLALGNQALVMCRLDLWDQSIELFEEQEEICRDIGNTERLVWGLNNKTEEQEKRGLLSEALETMRRNADVLMHVDEPHSLARNLYRQVYLLAGLNRMAEAIGCIDQVILIYRQIDSIDGVAEALSKKAYICFHVPERRDEAKALGEEAISLARTTRNQKLIRYIEETMEAIRR